MSNYENTPKQTISDIGSKSDEVRHSIVTLTQSLTPTFRRHMWLRSLKEAVATEIMRV